jgi:hypothetical protein
VGGGGSKTHESFVVSPSVTAPPPEAGVTTGYEVWVKLPDSDKEILAEGPFATYQEAELTAAALGLSSIAVVHETEVQEPSGGGGDLLDDETPADQAPPEAPPGLEGFEADPAVPAGELVDVAAAAGAAWDDVLTPVPTEPTPGAICGTPLLVGGADLDDSLATLVSYNSAGGPREVLMATVTEEAEAKLYEALALSEEKLVPVSVDKEVAGRLPLDETHQLFEQMETVVKSTNHHLKAGDGVPAHTVANYDKLVASLSELEADPATTEADKAMVAHYLAGAEAIGERLEPGYATPYAEGGKVPKLGPYETTGTVTVTEYVPAPAEGVPEGLLPAQLRSASRIGSVVAADGSTSWNGSSRSAAKGKEYAVDLGDGYSAVYRPYVASDSSSPDFSQRGSLEVVAPQGAGHGPELVRRLGQLNLVNRPMSAAEGEWSYLTRNIEAQGLAKQTAVSQALGQADGLEDATQELLVAERAHEAIGMDHAQLVGFAKQLRLEAEAKALPEKVRLVREGVAQSLGMANGDALAASPGYDPTPRASGGWLVWDRFDVAADRPKVKAAFGERGLNHRVTNQNLLEVLTNGGVLACTERRRIMGVKPGKGMSEGGDMNSGGAKSVFLRVGTKASGGGQSLHWDDPTQLLRRSDWYAYNSDHFGSLNPTSGHSTSGMTRDPAKVASFGGGGNEVMFKNGIDLLGSEAPSRIKCGSSAERTKVLTLLATRGITHLGGKPVADVVVP